jgi:hypothetical protein
LFLPALFKIFWYVVVAAIFPTPPAIKKKNAPMADQQATAGIA